MQEKLKRGRRTVEGRVIRDRNSKTRVVAVEQRLLHPLYGRVLQRTTKMVAHDEREESNIGDVVRIQECRPLSKTKRWRLIAIIKKSSD
jgi:small subunit ribosomal protein S17